MPAAQTNFPGVVRNIYADLSNATEFRLSARVAVAGAAGAKLRVMCFISGGPIQDFADTPGTGDVAINVVGTAKGVWAPIDATARIEDCIVTIQGLGGDATADPQFGIVRMEYR
jgi:hypothetical protein